MVLEIPASMRGDVISRINGLERKQNLIKHAIRRYLSFNVPVGDLLCVTIGGINNARQYRDAVMHARMLDPDSVVANTFTKKGTVYEVPVSVEALCWLNDLIGLLREEAAAAYALVVLLYTENGYAQSHPHTIVSELFPDVDREKEQISQATQALTCRVQELHKKRQSLRHRQNFRRNSQLQELRRTLKVPNNMNRIPGSKKASQFNILICGTLTR